MEDYESDFVYLLPLEYHKEEIYHEVITHVPARMRGAFVCDSEQGKKQRIDFRIIDPSGSSVVHKLGNEYIFDYTTHTPGIYKVTFRNVKVHIY